MRLSLFLSGFFAVSSALGVAAVTEIVERDRADFTPVQALHTNDKRAICIWGICFGGSTPDYSSDVNNCGERNNCCPTSWSNGRGAQCVDGVCMPASCSNGWTLNTDTASCVNLANDVNNCGSLGNTCSLDGASAHSCSGGVCRATACVPGCGLYSGTCKDLNNDPANCGRLGNVCQFPGGTGTCSRGVCTLTSCGTGYYLSAGKCVQYNLQTDVNNCGSVGRVCSVPNGVAACSSGQCTVASCAAGYSQSGATCVAINTSTDPRNCGRLGNVCSFSNGAGTCTDGVCTYTSCSRSGYYVVGGQCVRLDLQTDPQNCGTLGKVCLVPNGLADCDCGQCVIASCATGFQQVGGACVAINTATDVKNCGRIGNVCSFTNGAGTCSNGACTYTSCQTSSGFYLVDGRCVALNLQTDPQNCGRFGNVCSVSNGVPGCNSGKCTVASCDTGYSQSGATCVAINTSTDPRNCGRLGNVCSFSNGAGTCTGGVCTYTSCSRSGYYVVGGQCVRLDLQTDPQNCGTLGKVCSVPNGLADCDCGQCVIASCATGFQQVGGACVAINTATDVKNCGRIGNVCSFTNGAGTCSNGACTYTSCQSSSGLYLVDGQCVAVNLQTDPQNCGRYGNVCSVSNGVPACSSGRCSIASCDVGYTPVKTLFLGFFLYTSCQAVDTSSDNLNCGAVGNVCDFSNGAGRCSSGVCTVTSCSPGYYLVNNKCVVIDLQTDPQNCGTLSNVCPAVENGVAGCDAGTCNIGSCNAGYAKVTTSWFFGLFPKTFCQAVNTDSDPKNCGSVGNVCPSSYLNGGSSTCRDGRCQTSCADGFDFDFVFNFCRPVSDDDQNCGRCGQKCSIPNAATQICSRGQCKVTACASGYTLSNNACVAANYQTDVNNCGSKGNVCSFSPAGASGACVAGQCVVQSCPRGYNLVNGKCILGASGRARAKRHTVPRPKTLCPAGEQACPIAGSTLFEGAASQHFKSGEELTGLMASSGGYECLDTTQALESCGGCASTGEGRDCTAIPHVGGVGCEAGQCVIFSCAEGWKRSLSGDKCIRVRARSHASHRNTTTSAARHLSRRAHRSSHHAHAVGGSSA